MGERRNKKKVQTRKGIGHPELQQNSSLKSHLTVFVACVNPS